MRKPSTYSLKNEEDASDTYSTSAPASTQAYLDDVSPHGSYAKEQSDDSDCFSDSSKKIRKKRAAYQKISDEIRCKLLDCVKNGETLKSAAKRFKINYSSAKSILHTFRKEGRILKKSAQERTIKKKPESMIDVEPKSSRMKKTPIHMEKEKTSKSLTNLGARGVYSKESTPVGSLTRLDEGGYEQGHYGGMEQESNGQQRKISYHHDDHHYKNYYMNYNDSMAHQQQQHHEAARSYMLTEGLEHQGHYGMHYPREYEAYTDMTHLHQHQRPAQADEYFSDPSAAFLHQRELNTHHQMEDRFFKAEHVDYEHAEHGYNNPLKSFMDTQSVFRDALRKANNISYSNSNGAGFRKSSIDLF